LIIMTSFAAAEREAVSAAEKAERKAQLRDKVSYFQCYIPAMFSCVAIYWLCRYQRSTQSFLFLARAYQIIFMCSKLVTDLLVETKDLCSSFYCNKLSRAYQIIFMCSRLVVTDLLLHSVV
jgi:hypothetical protein